MRVAIVGLGSAGWKAAAAVRRAGDFDPGAPIVLAAGADLDADAREAFTAEHAVPAEASVEALCSRSDVDAVFVASPNPFHARHALTAIGCGKHVLVEKPMANSLAEAAEVVEQARKHGVELMCVHTPAYHPAIQQMRSIVESGEYGRVLQVSNMIYTPWLRRPRSPDELRTVDGGGVCYRQGPHQVDIVRSLVGGSRAVSVHGVTGRTHLAPETEGNYSALIRFENSAVATIVYNGYGYFDTAELTWGVSLNGYPRSVGAGGRLRASIARSGPKSAAIMQQTERLESGSAQSAGREVHPVYGLTVVSCEHADLRQSPTGVAVYNDDGVEERPGRPWLGVLATELIEMARRLHGDPAVPRITCDGVWGQETLRICLAILESARVGQAASLASTSVRRWRP